VDNLNVHKEHDPDSSIISQLPVDLEIQILEQKNANGIDWGRIDKMKLSGGTKINAGWINLEYIQFPGEEEPEVIETLPPEPATEPVTITLPDPEAGITTMGTVTTGKLNVRKGYDEWTANEGGAVFDILVKGDQVKVTALDIIKDKVWGRVETNEGTGWIRLDYMSEGAVYVQAPVQNNPTTAPSAPVLGNTSSTGGFVNNTTGYRYTGKVIRANEVNVRATPSTTAQKTTTLKNGAALVVYETTIAENMAWGRCDAGWVYLYYVDLTPSVAGAVDARVVFNDNTIIYNDVNGSAVAGSYARMSTVDIYEIVGKMARTELGWIHMDKPL
jgi:uncharacterized protein YraI